MLTVSTIQSTTFKKWLHTSKIKTTNPKSDRKNIKH